jgi:hypothetical protein
MSTTLSTDEIVGLMNFANDQHSDLVWRLRKATGKRITLLKFDDREFDFRAVKKIVLNAHETILPIARRKLVRQMTVVQGTILRRSHELLELALSVIPWNTTTSRYEAAKNFEFGYSVVHMLYWVNPSGSRVPSFLFEDGLHNAIYVLRFDDTPMDGLD